MRRHVATALSVLVVAAIPAILVGNALWVVLNPWFVEAQYALPGFPDDPHGLRGQARSDLAATGIRSVRPGGEGVASLREARLPSGRPAFQDREIGHMEDVRAVTKGFLTVWGVALVVAFGAGLGLRRIGGPEHVRQAVARGAVLTVAAIALTALLMLVDFDAFFTAFHGMFFEGDSWRFDSSFTLRRLYPDSFWGIAGAAMAGLVLLQAAVPLVLLGRTHAPCPR